MTASREIKHDNRIYVHGIVREMSHNQLNTRTSENDPRPSEFYVPLVNFQIRPIDNYITVRKAHYYIVQKRGLQRHFFLLQNDDEQFLITMKSSSPTSNEESDNLHLSIT